MEDRENEISWLGNLGSRYTTLGDKQHECIFTGTLGSAFARLQQNDKALQRIEKSVALAFQLEDGMNIGHSSHYLGRSMLKLNRHSESIEAFKTSIEYLTSYNGMQMNMISKSCLAYSFAQQALKNQAEELLSQMKPALTIHPNTKILVHCYKAKTLYLLQCPAEALQELERAKSIAPSAHLWFISIQNLLAETTQILQNEN